MTLSQLLKLLPAGLKNLALAMNVAGLRFVGRPVLLTQYASEVLFLGNALSRARGLPERHIADFFPLDLAEDVTLAHPKELAWNQPVGSYLIDLVSLCLICKATKPLNVFEIGTSAGLTAFHFALNTEANATVVTLDLDRQKQSRPALRITPMDEMHVEGNRALAGYYFSGHPVASKIECKFGDSATFDFTPWHNSVDLFFIDGAHSYEYVASDTANALRCVKRGGVIAWHDFGRSGVNGVSRVLRERAAEGLPICAVPGGSLAFMQKD